MSRALLRTSLCQSRALRWVSGALRTRLRYYLRRRWQTLLAFQLADSLQVFRPAGFRNRGGDRWQGSHLLHAILQRDLLEAENLDLGLKRGKLRLGLLKLTGGIVRFSGACRLRLGKLAFQQLVFGAQGLDGLRIRSEFPDA